MMVTPLEMQGEPHLVLEPSQAWEKTHGHVTEGPWMLKHGGRRRSGLLRQRRGWPELRRGLCRQRQCDGALQKVCR